MKRFILLLSIMVFSFTGIPACKDKTDKGDEMSEQEYNRKLVVTIRPDLKDPQKGIIAEPDEVELIFGTNQSVTWVKEGFPPSNGPDFIVNFNKHGPSESPFKSRKFGHGDGLNSNSGPAVVDPGPEGQRYGYSVVVPGYVPLDPAIIIRR